MKHQGRSVRLALAIATISIMFMPTGARADVAVCRTQIETQVGALRTSIYKALQLCKDKIGKELAKGIITTKGTSCQTGGGCMAAAAQACENKLKTVYGIGALSNGSWAVKTFRKNIENARSGKCAAALSNNTCHANAECMASASGLPWSSPNGAVGMAQCIGPGQSTVGPRACCTGARTGTCAIAHCTAVCTDEDLSFSLAQDGGTLGHLLSDATSSGGHALAPPINSINCNADGNAVSDTNCASKWLIDFLLLATERLTIKQQLMSVPDMLAFFQDAVAAQYGGAPSKLATSCSPVLPAPATNFIYRPNLCRFGIECREHVCQVDDGGTCPDTSPCQTSDTSGLCNGVGPGCQTGDPSACSHSPTACVPNACSGTGCVPNKSFLQEDAGSVSLPRIPILGMFDLTICKPGRAAGNCKFPVNAGAPCQADTDCGINGPCNLGPGEGLGSQMGVEPDFLYLTHEPSKTMRLTIPPALSGLYAAACLQMVRSEGWCDCNGAGLPVNFVQCQAEVAQMCHRRCTIAHPTLGVNEPCTSNAECTCSGCGGGTCSAATTCGNGSACGVDADCTLDACLQEIDTTNEDPRFPGTVNGRANLTATGASMAGDCLDLVSMQFTVLLAENDFGPDHLPCTVDDFVAPQPVFTLPLTTGTATGMLRHAINTVGSCTHSGHCSSTSTQACDPTVGGCPGVEGCVKNSCVQDVNCAIPADTCTGVKLANLSIPVSGAKSSCDNYAASNLSGLGLAGVLTQESPVGDLVVGLRFGCK